MASQSKCFSTVQAENVAIITNTSIYVFFCLFHLPLPFFCSFVVSFKILGDITNGGTLQDIAVATIEADVAIASSDFLKIMVFPSKKEPTGVFLVSFDHFASSDFNVWLLSCKSMPKTFSSPSHSEC